jgi:hypothetical protein
MATVVISDIHIGNNSRTNWYQQTIHEKYLVTALDWIIANKEVLGLTKFLILGDLFDYWTYAPNVAPPYYTSHSGGQPGVIWPR